MNSDWVKMRTDLYRDPKVIWIADCLFSPTGELAKSVGNFFGNAMTVTRNVTRNATVGALVTVWGTVRHRGHRVDDDLVLTCAELFTVDEMADLPGLGAAMKEVGWVEERDGSLVFPRFFEDLNYDPSEEKKAKDAERQKRYRERNRNVTRYVTVTSQSNTEKSREEKSREEYISINTPPSKKDDEEEKEADQEKGSDPGKPDSVPQRAEPIPGSAPAKPTKPVHGMYVHATDEEIQKLEAKHGPDIVAEAIEKLDGWIGSDPTPKRIRNGKNGAATMRTWVIKAVLEDRLKLANRQQPRFPQKQEQTRPPPAPFVPPPDLPPVSDEQRALNKQLLNGLLSNLNGKERT